MLAAVGSLPVITAAVGHDGTGHTAAVAAAAPAEGSVGGGAAAYTTAACVQTPVQSACLQAAVCLLLLQFSN